MSKVEINQTKQKQPNTQTTGEDGFKLRDGKERVEEKIPPWVV